jgi:hypothetical protein
MTESKDRLVGLQAALDHIANARPLRRFRLVAVYPDGSEYEVVKRNHAYWWKPNAGSYPLSAARQNVEALGGRIERRWS